jgi:hypothetical protein
LTKTIQRLKENIHDTKKVGIDFKILESIHDILTLIGVALLLVIVTK